MPDENEPEWRINKDFYSKWNPRVRDGVLFVVGVGGLINEIWFEPDARLHVLVFLLSLLGIPAVEALDKIRQERSGKS